MHGVLARTVSLFFVCNIWILRQPRAVLDGVVKSSYPSFLLLQAVWYGSNHRPALTLLHLMAAGSWQEAHK
jgi:hypothetical protein